MMKMYRHVTIISTHTKKLSKSTGPNKTSGLERLKFTEALGFSLVFFKVIQRNTEMKKRK